MSEAVLKPRDRPGLRPDEVAVLVVRFDDLHSEAPVRSAIEGSQSETASGSVQLRREPDVDRRRWLSGRFLRCNCRYSHPTIIDLRRRRWSYTSWLVRLAKDVRSATDNGHTEEQPPWRPWQWVSDAQDGHKVQSGREHGSCSEVAASWPKVLAHVLQGRG